MIPAMYFDGRHGTAVPVQVTFESDTIRLSGGGIDRSVPLRDARIGEPFEFSPDVVELGDGAHLEVQDRAQQQMLLQALHYKPSMVVRFQAMWPAALAAILVLAAIAFVAYEWGIPRLTSMLVDRLPPSAEEAISEEMLPRLDHSVFQPSQLSNGQKQAARAILEKMRPAHPRMPLRLVFRQSPVFGANAFAMPDGAIVVTDQMIKVVDPDQTDLQGEAGDRLAGVLAHEIGHVEKRHTLKSMLSNSMVAALAASLFGDFSAIAAAAPAIAVSSVYSREMESEADGYAIASMKQHGISPAIMADTFEMLQADAARRQFTAVPGWMRVVTDYTASHPADEERIARFRAAAGDVPSSQSDAKQ